MIELIHIKLFAIITNISRETRYNPRIS